MPVWHVGSAYRRTNVVHKFSVEHVLRTDGYITEWTGALELAETSARRKYRPVFWLWLHDSVVVKDSAKVARSNVWNSSQVKCSCYSALLDLTKCMKLHTLKRRLENGAVSYHTRKQNQAQVCLRVSLVRFHNLLERDSSTGDCV